MLIGLTQQRGKLLFIGWINGITFDGNVGKGFYSFRRGSRTITGNVRRIRNSRSSHPLPFRIGLLSSVRRYRRKE